MSVSPLKASDGLPCQAEARDRVMEYMERFHAATDEPVVKKYMRIHIERNRVFVLSNQWKETEMLQTILFCNCTAEGIRELRDEIQNRMVKDNFYYLGPDQDYLKTVQTMLEGKEGTLLDVEEALGSIALQKKRMDSDHPMPHRLIVVIDRI